MKRFVFLLLFPIIVYSQPGNNIVRDTVKVKKGVLFPDSSFMSSASEANVTAILSVRGVNTVSVADTTALKGITGDSVQTAYLRGITSSSLVGSGFFVKKRKSDYPLNSVTTYEATQVSGDSVWVRQEYLSDGIVQVAWAGTGYAALQQAFNITAARKFVLEKNVLYDSAEQQIVFSPTRNVEIEGNGAKIKIRNQVNSLVTASSGTSITVTSSTGMYVGQQMMLSTGASDKDSSVRANWGGIATATISNINGNILTMSRSLTTTATGLYLFSTYDLFYITGGGATKGSLKLKNVWFDGNLTNYNYNFTWQSNFFILSSYSTVIAESCYFSNFLGGIQSPSVQLVNCRFDSGVAAVHFSQDAQFDETKLAVNMIDGCTFYKMGLGAEKAGHNQAVLTPSLYPTKLDVRNSEFLLCRSPAFQFNETSQYFRFINNRMKGDTSNQGVALELLAESGVVSHVSNNDKLDVRITGNDFDKSGSIMIFGYRGNYAGTNAFYNFEFSNNKVHNGIIYALGIQGGMFANNRIFLDSTANYSRIHNQRSFSNDIMNRSAMSFQQCGDLTLTNNTILISKQDTGAYCGLSFYDVRDVRLFGGEIRGFNQGFNVQMPNPSPDHRIEINGLTSVAFGDSAITNSNCAGFIQRGTNVCNSTLRFVRDNAPKSVTYYDHNGVLAIRHFSSGDGAYDSVGSVVMGNVLETKADYAIITTDISTASRVWIVGNVGFSGLASASAASDTGMVANITHGSSLNTVTGNYLRKANAFGLKDVRPTWIDYMKWKE